MKNPRWFGRLASSHVRIASAIALIFTAAAIAFVAAKSPESFLSTKAEKKHSIDKFRQERDGAPENSRALPGRDRGPLAAAEEEYSHRAYPAADVPMELTRQASKGWERMQAQANARLNSLTGFLLNWTLAGPSMANFPGVLTFSGASYTTSGRITALAVDPSCSATGAQPPLAPASAAVPCRVWAAAAGGGIWRTDNVLDPIPTWTFISGSFATNAIGTLTYDAANSTLYAGTGEPNASADSEAGFGIYKSIDGGDNWTHLASNTSVPTGAGVDCTAVVGSGGVQSAPAYTGPAFDGRAIGSIAVDPLNSSTLYVGSTRAVRGVSSVASGGAVSLAPGLPPFGIWKSTDGGANFTLLNYVDVCLNPTTPGSAGIVQSSFGSSRGVHEVAIDTSTGIANGPAVAPASQIIYAAPFPQINAAPVNTGGGVWRSANAGGTWTQIKTALNATRANDRAVFAITNIPASSSSTDAPGPATATRMYVGVGNDLVTTANQARLYRTDDAVNATNASFTDLTAVQQASAAPNQTLNYCGDPAAGAQCWYDNVVYTPAGEPDTVYLGGSFNYSNYGGRNNGRAFIRSTDAGSTFTDMTWDSTSNPTPPGSCCQPNPFAPNGMHPDSHAMVELPGSNIAIFGGDGGLVRTSGRFASIASQCASRGLSGTSLATCQQLLSAVPTALSGINNGLSTLQFQSLSVAADSSSHVQGGTQDNGTFETTGSTVTWPQIVYGDGGQTGFHLTNSAFRFNSFTSNFHDVNFQNGDPTKWVIASGPIAASGETAQFYAPIISDPAAAGTIFQGSLSVWRTKDWAGNQAFLEANCPEFFTSGTNTACGDFVKIGPSGATDLTASVADYRGTTRSGGNVAAFARTTGDTGTLWVATTTGRVFISKNADNATNTAVTFTRIDSTDVNSPGRFVSGIFIDPSDSNHAWLSYSSYSTLTPSQPGHVFSVTYFPAGLSAGKSPSGVPTGVWTNLDGVGVTMFPDFPATGIVRSTTGDLFVSNDWGVLRLPSGSTSWEIAGNNLPMVEVAGLTMSADGLKLYAATHGRSAWVADLPTPTPTPSPTPTPTPSPTPSPTPTPTPSPTPTPTPSPTPTPTPSPTPTPTPSPTPTPTPMPGQVATPVISPSGGSFQKKVEIRITDATQGASIFFTTNGTDPTMSSTHYTGPFKIKGNGTHVIKAKAFKTGLTPSDTRTATFNIHG